MDMKKTFGSFIIALGTVSVMLGLLTPMRAEADQRFGRSTLATAPLAIPRFGVMECTAANLSGRDIEVRISQLQHFRENPSLPNDPFVIEKTQILAPGQATSVGGTVGSDPAIGRCTFEFKGYKNRVRAAAVVLEDVSYVYDENFSVTVTDGTSIAVIEAK
jgi:hypothetical protein